MSNLDLSTGKEHRISVDVSGWGPTRKDEFAGGSKLIPGVLSVQGAGGSSSFYVNYDPTLVSEDGLSERLRDLARSIGALPEVSAEQVPRTLGNDLIVDGAPVTIDGQSVSIGGDFLTTGVGSPDQLPESRATISSSAWTGIASLQERAIAFKQLAPVAIAAVNTLVMELDSVGHNGGPPLPERKEAIEALRQLHDALGALLAAIERPGFAWADNEGLSASCTHYAMRAYETLRDDPIPFAASGLLLLICSVFGFPGAGGFVSGMALAIRKRGKS